MEILVLKWEHFLFAQMKYNFESRDYYWVRHTRTDRQRHTRQSQKNDVREILYFLNPAMCST